MTRNEIEAALDAHKLFVRCMNGKSYQARRNGRTQTWKTRPNDFRIPIKWCLRNCGAIDQDTIGEELEIRA